MDIEQNSMICRSFSLSEACLHQGDSERGDNILITSSSDHFIRLWSKVS